MRRLGGRRAWEPVVLALVPVVELAGAFLAPNAAALLTLLVCLLVCALMAAAMDRGKPPLAQLLPTVVMAAIAAAGRVAFAAIPFVKPVSAVAIVAGATLGPHSGFATGALAALVSNLVFGQGPWTPLQMYAWGLIGYLGGVLSGRGMLRGGLALCAWGLVSGLLYGFILDSWHILGFVRPLTWQAAGAAYVAGLGANVTHGVATAAFLSLIWLPWRRAISRVLGTYGIDGPIGPDHKG